MAPKRPRTLARAAARDARKLVEAKTELAALEIGGSLERPLEVASASLVEARALAGGCLACEGALEVADHRVHHAGAALVREVVVHCRRCSRRRGVWVRVAVARAH
jgi:hypothetical protein